MSDQFVAEIRIYPFNFPPRGWAFCNGQLMPISQNTALFSLVGTIYGGDGKSTFALPDIQGRAPVQPGRGSGLSSRDLGEAGGSPTVTLLESEIPSHSHTLNCNAAAGNRTTPAGNAIARVSGGAPYAPAGTTNATLSSQTLVPAGGDQPHNNMQPYLALNFCIALQGIFPSRP